MRASFQRVAPDPGVRSLSLDEALSTNRVIVVFVSVTSENRGFLGKRKSERFRPVFLLMSRAGVVDFPEFLRQVDSGRFRAATDVHPTQPAPKTIRRDSSRSALAWERAWRRQQIKESVGGFHACLPSLRA